VQDEDQSSNVRSLLQEEKICFLAFEMMNTFLPPLAGPTHDKINRELFVGNTPPGTSELLLLHFLSAAMRRVNLCESNETPVLGVRVSSKFAFVELATMELANKCLNLNGIPVRIYFFFSSCYHNVRSSNKLLLVSRTSLLEALI
jgi:hypothetical protein